MFPAIFAVLLLGQFVAAEIYVGQNPQNVNAVIKDANGNLVPVTGVADEIVVVDLNYGGEGNSSGMSVDVSVTPVNGSSSSGMGYSPSEYPSSISLPAAPTSQISNPPLSASPTSAAPASAAASNLSSISNLGSSSSSASGFGSSSGASGLGVGLNIPTLPPVAPASTAAPSIFNPPAQPPSKSPVSEFDNLVSNLSGASGTKTGVPSSSNGSKNKNSNGPSLFNNPFAGLFGGAQNKPPKNTGPAFPSFVELGGSLGPAVNLTPVDVSNPFVSNITSSTSQNKNKNIPFFNMTNMMMNLSSPFQFPPNTNATPLNSILGSLFNSSTVKMQPVNSNTTPLGGLINSFLGGSQSMSNPGNSNASPLGSLMNSFMNPSASPSPFGGSSSSPITDMLNSFMNSSSLFNSSSTDSPLEDMMNSFSSANGSPFSGLSGLFSPSGNGIMSSLMDSLSNPTNASSISDMMSPFLGGNSSIFNLSSPLMPSDSTNLNSMLQSFLPPGMFGDSDYEYGSDSDDEDYFDPLSSLLPPQKSSSLPSLSDTSASGLTSSDGQLLNGVENMENNLFTPTATGKTPLTGLINSIFGTNGAAPPSTSPFALGGLLNPMTFANGSSFNLTSAFQNRKPLSGLQNIISSLNSTGLFGNLSPVLNVAQKLSSIVSQSMNNKTNVSDNFDEIMSNIMSLWQDTMPIMQTFMKNMASKQGTLNLGSQAVPLTHSSPAASMPMPFGFGSSFLVIPTSSADQSASNDTETSVLPALSGTSASGIVSSDEPLIDGVENMENNLITPTASGQTPLASLLDSVFGANGTAPPSKSPFSFGGLLNPMTFANRSSSNLTADFQSFKPFSEVQGIISSLNSTGLFGDLTPLLTVAQNLTAIVTDAMNNKTTKPDFSEIMSDIMSVWTDVTPILQNLMKNLTVKPLMQPSPSASMPMPFGFGSSFLVIPTSTDQSAPAQTAANNTNGTETSPLLSLSGASASGLTSSDEQLLDGVENMENNLFTPTASGQTPLAGLLSSVFGANGTASPSTSPFALGGLLNPMSFMNGSSFNLTSAFQNRKPLSGLQNIVSSLNSTGLFGDLSPILTVAQNLTSIVTQDMNNGTKNINFGDIMSNIMSLWQDIMPIEQMVMKNMANKPLNMQSSQSAFMPLPLGFGSSFLVLPTAGQNDLTDSGALNDTETSVLPSLGGTSASGIVSSDESLIDGVENMENNLITPTASGKTPLASLLDSVFGANGTAPPSKSPFSFGGLLNPMTFANRSSSNLTADFQNFTPFSSIQGIISSLNSTGLFGDLTPLLTVAQNLTAIVTEDINNKTAKPDFSEIMSDIMSVWTDVTPILQNLMKNLTVKPLTQPSPSAFMPMPRGFGSSFVVLPTLPESQQSSDVQASGPAPEPESEPKPSPAETSTSAPVSSGTSTSPQPTTNQNNNGAPATTPSTNTNGTKTAPSAGGINLSSIWITLVGCLFVAFSQKNFLGL